MIRLLVSARYLSLALVLGLLVLLLAMGRHVTYDQSLTSFFPEGDPVVQAYQEASEVFGNDNFVFVGYTDPDLLTPGGMDRLAELTARLGPDRIPAVRQVESLDRTPQFWRFDDELIRIANLPAFLRPAARRLALQLVESSDAVGESLAIGAGIRLASTEELGVLRQRILTHPLLEGTLIDRTGTATVVVTRLAGMADQDVRSTVDALRNAADEFAASHGFEQPALVGPPVLLADGFSAIERDGRRLATAGMILIAFVMLIATRSLWWALLPLLAGWVVWLAAETVLSILGLKLSLSGGPLVAQIIVLTMPAASHLAIHFRDDLRRGGDRRAAALETLGSVWSPVVWCAVTGMLGYAALVTSDVVPVYQFGAVLAICTLCAAILVLLTSPAAMCPPFPLELKVRTGSTSRVTRLVDRLIHTIVRYPWLVVLAVLAATLPLIPGMTRLEYESNYINAFKPGARIVEDYHRIERQLGGIGVISLVVPAPEVMNQAALRDFRNVEESLIAAAAGPGRAPVSRVLSLASVLDPEGRLAELPEAKGDETLATKLELIAAAPQGRLMRNFWNPDAGLARLLVRIPEAQPAREKDATFRETVAQAQQVFGPTSHVTGLSYLLTRTTRGVMASSWTCFAWALGSILIMLVVAFRSPVLALLSILPSVLAVGLVLGLMGLSGVKLDLATALIASVALGLSVDDTFHCLIQYRRHRAQNDSFEASLFASYQVSGPGVVLSSLAVSAGFAVLWISQFVPFSNFGMMVGIATLGSSLGNLLLLPACLAILDRRKHPTSEQAITLAQDAIPDRFEQGSTAEAGSVKAQRDA